MMEYTIGEAARRAGVNIETLRYYERRGLLPPPPRSRSNYRIYPDDSVRIVRFVKRAQELGFTLKEVKELLSFRQNSDANCAEVRQQAQAKARDIATKIKALQAMHGAISELVDQCSGRGSVEACPILESLEPDRRPR